MLLSGKHFTLLAIIISMVIKSMRSHQIKRHNVDDLCPQPATVFCVKSVLSQIKSSTEKVHHLIRNIENFIVSFSFVSNCCYV